jgi:Sec23/Sec24 trunk domain/Sec23/Sec24 zinc finger
MAELTKPNIIKCPSSSLPPVLCLTCLAYINKYCETDYSTGKWTCALCATTNVLPKKYIEGTDALLTPALTCDQVEYHQPLTLETDRDDICTMMLVVDRNLNASDALGILPALKKVLLNLGKDHPIIHLGLVVFDQSVAMYHLGHTNSHLASSDIYPVQEDEDEVARQKAMEERPYLQVIKTEADFESLSRCLSAVFSQAKESVNDSTYLTRTGSASRMQVLKERKQTRLRLNTASPVVTKESPWLKLSVGQTPKRCTGEALECAMDLASVRRCRTSKILLFTNGCPNMGEGSVVAEKKEKKTKFLPKGKKKHQSVDDGQLAKGIQYYDTLATLAMETGIAIDVICAGWMELGLPAYQALVAPSGGYVIPQSSLEEPRLVHNLEFLLKHTHVSRTDHLPAVSNELKDQPRKGIGSFFRRKEADKAPEASSWMSECVVDIRTDSFIAPTHLVGPGEVLDAGASKDGASRLLMNEKAAFAAGVKLAEKMNIATTDIPSAEALDLSLTRIRIPRADPLATVSVVVQVNDTIEPDEDKVAFVQLTARSVSRDGTTIITRVNTHRLPVAESVSDYVKNVDDEVISVLLAKNAVYRSMYGREETSATKDKVVGGDPATLEKLAYDTQLDLDATIQRISGAFRLLGLEEQTKKLDLENGPGEKEALVPASSLDLAFPPQLSGCLRQLYHLRRGALVSPGPLRSMDDRAESRHLFLRFPLEDCLGMLAPKLWSTGRIDIGRDTSNVTTMIPFPAETMALWDAVCSCDIAIYQNIGRCGLR